MTSETDSRTVLGEDSLSLSPADDGGAELEISEDIADVLDLDDDTVVEVSFRVVDDTDVRLDLEFPNVDVTDAQRDAIVELLAE